MLLQRELGDRDPRVTSAGGHGTERLGRRVAGAGEGSTVVRSSEPIRPATAGASAAPRRRTTGTGPPPHWPQWTPPGRRLARAPRTQPSAPRPSPRVRALEHACRIDAATGSPVPHRLPAPKENRTPAGLATPPIGRGAPDIDSAERCRGRPVVRSPAPAGPAGVVHLRRRLRPRCGSRTDPELAARCARHLARACPYAEPLFIKAVRGLRTTPIRRRPAGRTRPYSARAVAPLPAQAVQRSRLGSLPRHGPPAAHDGSEREPGWGRRSWRFRVTYAAGGETISYAVARWTEGHLSEFRGANRCPRRSSCGTSASERGRAQGQHLRRVHATDGSPSCATPGP